MKEWLEKYLIWTLLGIIFIMYILSKLFLTKDGKPEVLEKAKEKITALKDKKKAEHEAIVAKAKEKRLRLDEIKKIKDKKERLQALADYSNE